MRTICSMAAGFGLAVSVFAAPIASALPGEGPVAVQCQVYADNNFGPPGFGPGGMPGMGFGICRDGGDRQMCGIGARDVGGAVLGALGSPGADSRQVTPCTGLGDENRQNRSTRACEVREIQLGRRISGG